MPGLSCSMWDLFPDQGCNPGPLHWEHGILATGPPGKPQGVGLLRGKGVASGESQLPVTPQDDLIT